MPIILRAHTKTHAHAGGIMSSQPGAPAASSPTTVVPLDGRPAGAGRGSFSSGSSANGSSTSSMMPTPPVAVQVDMAGPSSPAPGAATAAALLCHSRDVKGDGVGHAVGGNDVVSNGGNAGAEGKQCDVLSGTSMANGRNPTNNAQVVNILATTGCTVGQDVEYELAALPDTLQTALLQFAGVDTKKLKVSGAPVPKKVSRKRLQEAIVAVDQRRRVRRGLQCVVGVLCLACFLMLLCIACIIPGTGGGNSLSEATELSSSNPTLLVDGTDMAVRTASADIEAGNDLGVMYSRKTGTPMQVCVRARGPYYCTFIHSFMCACVPID